MNDISSTDLSSTFSAIESLQDALKGKLPRLNYIFRLALLERSRIKGLRAEQLDVFTEGRIKGINVKAKSTLETDMADRFYGWIGDADRLVAFSAEAQLGCSG
ncbi:hypothetical protein O9993_07355 [Vibrio lentus]|nr:hypothetical protein [Vibrio lentus]